MGFLPKIGLSRQSGSLNLHRFDSRKVVSWITFCIPAIFPKSHKWPAVTLGSTGMLNTQLLLHHPDVPEVLHSHTCTSAAAGWANHHGVIMGTFVQPVPCWWPQVGICPGAWTANTLGPMCCTDTQIWVWNLALKHSLMQHNWVIVFANLATVTREKLCHNLGYPAVMPTPLESKAHNAWRKMPVYSSSIQF